MYHGNSIIFVYWDWFNVSVRYQPCLRITWVRLQFIIARFKNGNKFWYINIIILISGIYVYLKNLKCTTNTSMVLRKRVICFPVFAQNGKHKERAILTIGIMHTLAVFNKWITFVLQRNMILHYVMIQENMQSYQMNFQFDICAFCIFLPTSVFTWSCGMTTSPL